jgi:hypothetical protein
MADSSGKTIRLILFILVAFAAAGMYYLMVNMKSFIDSNPKKLVLYYKEAKRFTPEKKSDFLKNHTGFWTYQSYAMVGGVPLKKIDLLELKDNGIIWQVIEWHVKMPSGKNAAFYQIRTGYMEPYGTMRNDTLNDFYTIHQSFISSHDTCFGGWNFLDLWVVRREGTSLIVCKRRYEQYTGVVADFFPHGMIDLVGTGGGSANRFIKKIGNGSGSVQIELNAPVQGIKHANADLKYANAMAMPDCLTLNSLNDLLKQELFGEFAGDRKSVV